MPEGRLSLLMAALGVAAGSFSIAIALDDPSALTLPAVVHVAIGWSFVVAGLVARRQRPANRMGLLVLLTGVVWFCRDADWVAGPVHPHLAGASPNVFLCLLPHQGVLFPNGP